MSLSSGIHRFGQRVIVQNEQMRRAIITELFGSVIKDTPVDTGRARANWQTEINSPKTNELNTNDKTGAGAKAEVLAKANASRWGDALHLTNNLPYIFKLEYGGYPNPPKLGSYNKKTKKYEIKSVNGFSKQAAQGMFRRNILRITAIVQKHARRLSR